jgi:hypothetical protein
LFLIWLTLTALILSVLALLSLRADWKTLVGYRKALIVLSAVADAVSAIVLLTFLIVAYRMAHGQMPSADLDRAYPVFAMMGLGLLGVVTALFGKRFSRWLLLVAGVLTTYLWYLAALAVSP